MKQHTKTLVGSIAFGAAILLVLGDSPATYSVSSEIIELDSVTLSEENPMAALDLSISFNDDLNEYFANGTSCALRLTFEAENTSTASGEIVLWLLTEPWSEEFVPDLPADDDNQPGEPELMDGAVIPAGIGGEWVGGAHWEAFVPCPTQQAHLLFALMDPATITLTGNLSASVETYEERIEDAFLDVEVLSW